jgi:ubiquinone/menaquinone biosynthesis C-methylase UbiE
MKEVSENKPDVVEYRVGLKGLANAESYDAVRYTGPAKEYKQAVMAATYKRLIGPLRGKRVLDVGCGTGRGVIEFAPEADFAVGSDASLDMLCFAQRKASTQTNCTFSAAYAQQLPFPDGVFDVVISLNFLHLFKLETQREMIAEMKRVVKFGGILVLVQAVVRPRTGFASRRDPPCDRRPLLRCQGLRGGFPCRLEGFLPFPKSFHAV